MGDRGWSLGFQLSLALGLPFMIMGLELGVGLRLALQPVWVTQKASQTSQYEATRSLCQREMSTCAI